MVPLNLEGALRLNHGRAFVGFTAGTGKDTWQVRGLSSQERLVLVFLISNDFFLFLGWDRYKVQWRGVIQTP